MDQNHVQMQSQRKIDELRGNLNQVRVHDLKIHKKILMLKSRRNDKRSFENKDLQIERSLGYGEVLFPCFVLAFSCLRFESGVYKEAHCIAFFAVKD